MPGVIQGGCSGKLNRVAIFCCAAAVLCLALLWLTKAQSGNRLAAKTSEPELTVSVLMSGLSVPWDITFTPDGTMLVNQRGGGIKARLDDGTVKTVQADFSDLRAVGEGGLMGMVVDPDFSNNRRFYTCQGHQNPQEIQVISWTINNDYDQATRVDDPLVGGIPMHGNGRHSGCRLRFGASGYLYISTGDAATGTTPQDLTSLAGKVLRVNASNGQGAPGNPYLDSSSSNSKLIYSYGHRNPQGLALRPGSSQMWVVEHGPDVNDEINLLQAGGNYGWNPLRAGSQNNNYYEYNPMTDTAKYPNAVEAKWSSGRSTYATAGGIFLEGSHWGDKEGWLAVATLKNSTLYLFDFSAAGEYSELAIPPELNRTYNRLRSVSIGPDKALYITSNDAVLRVAPEEESVSTRTPPVDPPPILDTTPPTITVSLTEARLTASTDAADVDHGSWRSLRITSLSCNQNTFSGSFNRGSNVNLSNLPAGNYIYCFAVRDQNDNWSYETFEFEITAQTRELVEQDPDPAVTEEFGMDEKPPVTPITTTPDPEPNSAPKTKKEPETVAEQPEAQESEQTTKTETRSASTSHPGSQAAGEVESASQQSPEAQSQSRESQPGQQNMKADEEGEEVAAEENGEKSEAGNISKSQASDNISNKDDPGKASSAIDGILALLFLGVGVAGIVFLLRWKR